MLIKLHAHIMQINPSEKYNMHAMYPIAFFTNVFSEPHFMAGVHHQFRNRRVLHLHFSPHSARGHRLSHAG